MRIAPLALTLALALTCLAPSSQAETTLPLDPVATEIRAGKPLVIYVVVPLCDNDQINCGSPIAGRPAGLAHNTYWGAVFGARRFFERKNSGWERVELTQRDAVFLERGVYRRRVPGAPWGKAGDIEQLVVLQAIRGSAIDQAIDHLWSVATSGARVTFQDGASSREERVLVAGYAGHNRLMDGKTLPPDAVSQGGAPIPSFVLACRSEPYFGPSLRRVGATPLVTTASLMAPEGYMIDAVARGIGERLDPGALRRRAVSTYAKWQKLTPREAGAIFAKP